MRIENGSHIESCWVWYLTCHQNQIIKVNWSINNTEGNGSNSSQAPADQTQFSVYLFINHHQISPRQNTRLSPHTKISPISCNGSMLFRDKCGENMSWISGFFFVFVVEKCIQILLPVWLLKTLDFYFRCISCQFLFSVYFCCWYNWTVDSQVSDLWWKTM